MAKTELQKAYIQRIDSLNDQLWYFLFTNEHLQSSLANLSVNANNLFTTDLFNTNPYAKKIHVRVGELPKHQANNKKLTFGAYFSTCYEIAGNYIEDLFELLKTTNGLATRWNTRTEPEANMSHLLSANGLLLPPPHLLNTFTYLRLRRNHFTHLASAANTRLTTFVATEGNNLNNHWRIPGVVANVDFTSLANVSSFTQPEAIELIKLLRICAIELDQHVASLLNTNELIRKLTEEVYGAENVRLNAVVRAQRNRKIASLARNRLGLTVSEAQTNPFITTIGVR